MNSILKRPTTRVENNPNRLFFAIFNLFVYLFCILLDSYDIINRIIASSDKHFAIFKTRLPWPLLTIEVGLCILGCYHILKESFFKNRRIQFFIIALYLLFFAGNTIYSLLHFSYF